MNVQLNFNSQNLETTETSTGEELNYDTPTPWDTKKQTRDTCNNLDKPPGKLY